MFRLSVLLTALAGCHSGDAVDTDTGTSEGDADADADADSDSDADTDSDSDGDTSAPEDTGPFDNDQDGFVAAVDCDDNDPLVNFEITLWPDVDLDGFGDEDGQSSFRCPGPGWVANSDDCDDSDSSINPAGVEIWCDGIDQNCDNQIAGDLEPARLGGVLYADFQTALDATPPGGALEICVAYAGGVVDHSMTLFAHTPGTENFTGLVIDAPVGSEVDLVDLTFKLGFNNVVDPFDSVGEGGCLWIGGGVDVNITDGAFDSCAEERGGAINAETTGTVDIDGTAFTDNAATVVGGAIWSSSDLVLDGASFATNTSVGDAGAIWASASLVMSDSSFSANTALGDGGAVWFSGSLASATNTTFDANSAADGGAVELSGAGDWIGGDLTSNVASARGGGIGVSGSWSLTGATLTTNVSTDEGGALYVGPGSDLSESGGTYDGDDSISGFDGVYVDTSSLEMTGSAFVNIDNNFTAVDSSVSLTNVAMTGGLSGLALDHSPGTVSDSTFSSENPCMDLHDAGVVTVDGSTFSGCTVGILLATDPLGSTDLVLSNSLVENSTLRGVEVFAPGGSLTLASQATVWSGNAADVEDLFGAWTYTSPGVDFTCDATGCVP